MKVLKKFRLYGATLAELLVYMSLFLLFSLSLFFISVSANKVYRILITKNSTYILLNKYANILSFHLISNPPLDDYTYPYTLDMTNRHRQSIKPACSTKLILYDIDYSNSRIDNLIYKKKYIYLDYPVNSLNRYLYNDAKIVEEYEDGNSKVIVSNIEALYFLLLDINGNYVNGDENNPTLNVSGYSVMAVLYLVEKQNREYKFVSENITVNK